MDRDLHDPIEIPLQEGKSVLEYLLENGYPISSPCGGKGRCGKCRVSIVSGRMAPPLDGERKLLSEKELSRGVRLACSMKPEGKVTIKVPDSSYRMVGKGTWETAFPETWDLADSWISKRPVHVPEPSMADQRSELARLIQASSGCRSRIALIPRLLRDYATALQNEDRLITLVEGNHSGETQLFAVEPGDTAGRLFGCAVDIGTTTIAVYLADLSQLKLIDTLSLVNRQGKYGADVISRISYFMETDDNCVTETVREQIHQMIVEIAGRNGVALEEIYRLVCVGNTTMIHFLVGVDPRGIALAPFVPVFTEELFVSAAELGLTLHPEAQVHIPPGISAYVGPDITAGILSSDIMTTEGPSLFIDVGTNGEIILQDGNDLWACSTAAGPAFEGASIRCGTGGEEGALNSFGMSDEDFLYTTIGDKPPKGICGAGLADIVALLLTSGIVDAKGKMITPEMAREMDGETSGEKRAAFSERICTIDGKPAFIVVPMEMTATGEAIVVSQKDIREIQLAKAAIAAGIETLLDRAALSVSEIKHLYLAGGFGSYVKKESAGTLGLIPHELVEKCVALGNAAGKGALYNLFSRKKRSEIEQIVSCTRYLELSGLPLFQKLFMSRMGFEPR